VSEEVVVAAVQVMMAVCLTMAEIRVVEFGTLATTVMMD
jgi:hypothetical protein